VVGTAGRCGTPRSRPIIGDRFRRQPTPAWRTGRMLPWGDRRVHNATAAYRLRRKRRRPRHDGFTRRRLHDRLMRCVPRRRGALLARWRHWWLRRPPRRKGLLILRSGSPLRRHIEHSAAKRWIIRNGRAGDGGAGGRTRRRRGLRMGRRAEWGVDGRTGNWSARRQIRQQRMSGTSSVSAGWWVEHVQRCCSAVTLCLCIHGRASFRHRDRAHGRNTRSSASLIWRTESLPVVTEGRTKNGQRVK